MFFIGLHLILANEVTDSGDRQSNCFNYPSFLKHTRSQSKQAKKAPVARYIFYHALCRDMRSRQLGCQKKIAKLIVEKKGDYVLSLKGNQGSLHDDVTTYFESSLSPEAAVITFDGDHGRIETRSVRVTDEIDWLKENHSLDGLRSLIAVKATRETKTKTTEETRYLISSLSADNPKQLEHVIRAHWAVENNLHWVLDMAFDEDNKRTRLGYIASNPFKRYCSYYMNSGIIKGGGKN